jgi:hypothetical protein
MKRTHRSVVLIAFGAAALAAFAMPPVTSGVGQGPPSASVYYPPPGDERWEKRSPEQVGMDPHALATAIELAKASDNAKEFSRNPREYIEARTAQEESGEILGPFRERTTVSGLQSSMACKLAGSILLVTSRSLAG